MKKGKATIVQIFTCLIAVSACWFSYLEKQNELTGLRLYAPKLVQEIKGIREKNTQLKYQIQQLESPENLIKLSNETKFNHLKHPFGKDILVLQEGKDQLLTQSGNTLAAGAP
ncbi:MAG: hypothetical protein V4489_07675 [Chlamydiota bacterium]